MTTTTRQKVLSKIALVSLCAIALTGCAQFEDSFGELRSPETQSSIAGASNSDGLMGSTYRSDRRSETEDRKAVSANVPRSLMIDGVRIEPADGQLIQ